MRMCVILYVRFEILSLGEYEDYSLLGGDTMSACQVAGQSPISLTTFVMNLIVTCMSDCRWGLVW
jgi:hypothetical protein